MSSPSRGAVALLQLILADECLLYTKVRHCYWNAAHPQSKPLLQLFEKQYDELARLIDQLAERIRSLGGDAAPTMAEFLRHTRVNEEPNRVLPATSRIVHQIIEDHETMMRSLNGDLAACLAEFEDAETGEFLGHLAKHHDVLAWRLRAFLTKA